MNLSNLQLKCGAFLNNFKDKLVSFPIEYRKLSLLIGSMLFFAVFPFIFKMQFDFSAQAWLSDDDEHIETLNEFERYFGSDERVMFLLELQEGELFDKDVVQTISEVTERAWQIPEVIRVESLTNFNWSYAEGDDLITEPFIPSNALQNQLFLAKREEDAFKHRVMPGVYFSKDGRSAIIYARLAHNPDAPIDAKKVTVAAEDIIADFNDDPRFKIHLLGDPVLSHYFQRVSFYDLGLMTPFLFLIVILYLFYTFRSLLGVVIPMTIILSSIGFTFGLIGLLGIKVNSLTFVLPSILMAISIADAVHILTSFFSRYSNGEELKQSLTYSLDKNLYPIFLTSISTAIGFFSLVASNIVPVSDLGLLAGLGTLSAMFFSYFFIPPLLTGLMSHYTKNKRSLSQRIIPREFFVSYVEWVRLHRLKIISLSFVLIVVAGYIGLQNRIDSNPFDYFQEDHAISKANAYTLEHYGGVGGPEIVIDSGEIDGVKNPDFLQEVDSFKQWLEEREYVNSVMSVLGVLKEMNQALFQGAEEEYRINDKREVIAQELFLYTMGLPQGMDINNQVDLEQKRLRLSVLWEVQNSTESLEKITEIEDEAKRRGLDAIVTGKAVLFQRMNGHVVYTFFTSIGLALILITIILIVVFRSVRVGMLSLIPNLVPVLMGAALLTILGIPIDIGCAIVASVTLGIAVDDTIHFLAHYNKLIKKGINRIEALVEVLSTTGIALIITSLILVSCFGIFMLASLTPNINFGVLCAFVISAALVCDFLLIPAAILSWKKAE
jgi:predicted RND superfamily exporter protein